MNAALFYRLNNQGELEGALSTHIDNFLHGVSDKFDEEMAGKLVKIFKRKKTETATSSTLVSR